MNKKYVYIIVAVLIVSCLIAFGRIAGNHFINFDDPGYITKNYIVQSGINPQSVKWAFSTTHLGCWHPLTWLSHMLDWHLFGANAGGHHLVSLLFHIGTVIFLFLFLFKTTHNLWPAAFAAAFFAIHPLRVESVAWVSERKDILSMFFGMASIYIYALYAEGLKTSRYFLCLTLFALSLMSKPMLVTLPCVLLLLDYWPLKRLSVSDSINTVLKNTGRLVWEKILFFLLTAALSFITFRAQKIEGAVSSADVLPFFTRAENALVSYVTYLEKTVWPVNLSVFYPYDLFLPAWKVMTALLVLLFITAAVIYCIKKLPFLFVGWFWYLGTLAPVIGLVQVGKQAMADRYTYLPSVGIAMMLAWSIPFLLTNKNLRQKFLFPAAISVLLFLSVLTWNQCGYWRSSLTLFNHAARVTKNAELVRGNTGADFTQLGQYQQQREIQNHNKAIQLNPHDALAHYNRGIAYSKIAQYQNAVKDYTETIRLKPDYAEAYNNRGNLYGQHGQYQLAVKDFNKVIDINPNHARAYNNRGLAYSGLGLSEKALESFSKAISLQPDYAGAYNNRADVHLKRGDGNSGCADAKKACELGSCATLQAARGKGLCR